MRRVAFLRPSWCLVLTLWAVHAATAQEPDLDISKFRLTFSEEFDSLDVSAWGPGTRWIAHTPWAGDFGDARFANPEPGFPFTVQDGVLRIEARKGADGKWRSGLLASVDKSGKGFSQRNGYFEMRAKFPEGTGVWPAFWLVGVNQSQYTAEIDVVEYYGEKPDRYMSVVHLWRKGGKHDSTFNRNFVFDKKSASEFNTYGVLVDDDNITMYFNRKEVWRTKTPEQHKQPMMILLNLALGGGFSIDKTPNPSYMEVDYVRAYAKQ
jgi:beta-glucanase (GH16 family)